MQRQPENKLVWVLFMRRLAQGLHANYRSSNNSTPVEIVGIPQSQFYTDCFTISPNSPSSQSAPFANHQRTRYYITNDGTFKHKIFARNQSSVNYREIWNPTLLLFGKFCKMGCVFSRNRVRVPRVFRRKKVSFIAMQENFINIPGK